MISTGSWPKGWQETFAGADGASGLELAAGVEFCGLEQPARSTRSDRSSHRPVAGSKRRGVSRCFTRLRVPSQAMRLIGVQAIPSSERWRRHEQVWAVCAPVRTMKEVTAPRSVDTCCFGDGRRPTQVREAGTTFYAVAVVPIAHSSRSRAASGPTEFVADPSGGDIRPAAASGPRRHPARGGTRPAAAPRPAAASRRGGIQTLGPVSEAVALGATSSGARPDPESRPGGDGAAQAPVGRPSQSVGLGRSPHRSVPRSQVTG